MLTNVGGGGAPASGATVAATGGAAAAEAAPEAAKEEEKKEEAKEESDDDMVSLAYLIPIGADGYAGFWSLRLETVCRSVCPPDACNLSPAVLAVF